MSANGKSLTWTSPATVAAIKQLGQLGSSGAIVDLAGAQAHRRSSRSGKLAMILNSSALQASLQGVAQGHFHSGRLVAARFRQQAERADELRLRVDDPLEGQPSSSARAGSSCNG